MKDATPPTPPAAPFVDPAAKLIAELRHAATRGLDAFDQYLDRHMEEARRLNEADRGRYDGEITRLRQQNFQF